MLEGRRRRGFGLRPSRPEEERRRGQKPQHSREDSYNILPPILQIEISHVIEDIDVVYKGDTQVSIYKNMIVQII